MVKASLGPGSGVVVGPTVGCHSPFFVVQVQSTESTVVGSVVVDVVVVDVVVVDLVVVDVLVVVGVCVAKEEFEELVEVVEGVVEVVVGLVAVEEVEVEATVTAMLVVEFDEVDEISQSTLLFQSQTFNFSLKKEPGPHWYSKSEVPPVQNKNLWQSSGC